MQRLRPLFFSLFVSSLLTLVIAAGPSQQSQAGIRLANRAGSNVTRITDGDTLKLSITLPSAALQPTSITFLLDPDSVPVAECSVEKGKDTCQTDALPTLGWYWTRDQKPLAARSIRASSTGGPTVASITIDVSPRPVVLVHGFGSSADAWKNYLGENGYLASIGVKGFAIGDGQVPGRLNLGDLANPTGKTETIASNAAILRTYIDGVKRATGAEMVDLVAHSMGNLVSRYYIDRVMGERDIAQMIMLGPPNSGTDCAYLPSALGYYLPSALEIRPSYVRNIFNRQVTRRHGIPFTIIAGTPILEPVQSPCTAVPSDLAIALDSAGGIPAPVTQVDVWHTDLNTSERVFADLVRPLLQKTVGAFKSEPDPATRAQDEPALQFTRIFTGHVDAGSSATVTINIDQVTVADFALFDPTRSLTVTVRGASGNTIALDPTRNGLVMVRDPATLVYLGYGFTNPRPGPWQITLLATDATPSTGTDYAVTAQFVGGAVLRVGASAFVPQPNEQVDLTAQLELAGQPLPVRDAQARIRYPAGEARNVPLSAQSKGWSASWTPDQPGIYAIDIDVTGTAPDGSSIERSGFLSIEVQPTTEQTLTTRLVPIIGIAIVAIILVGVFALRRIRQAARR